MDTFSTDIDADAVQAGSAAAGATRVDRIAQALIECIRGGQLPVGSRLPSVRALARQAGVSIQTALRAYDKLVARGYLEARRGSGFYVRYRRPPAPSPSWLQPGTTEQDWRGLLYPEVPYERRIGCGTLPEAWLDRPALASAIRAIGAGSIPALAGYADVRGYLPLRQQLQLKLREYGVEADPGQIVSCAGAVDALHLFIWSHLHPGSWVLVEDPAPSVHLQRLLANGLEFAWIPRHADGPDIDALREACVRHRPKAFFCSSLVHNPTGDSLSPSKAFQLLQLAEEFDLTVVDDCAYADLLPSSTLARQLPLAALDQLRRVVHVGSFSKTLGAGLRAGFLAARPECADRIALFKSAGAISNPVIGERLVHHLLSQGKYRHHCERLQSRLYDKRQRLLVQLAERGFVPERASAGMYLWLSLGAGVDARSIAEALDRRGHIAAPARGFFSHSPRYASYMRINVAVACDNPVLDLLAEEVASARRSGARPRR
ncbi:PLP-dependent aminotransferase family protein [Xanthomonas theicola]|nr:PLP-dependent aminotransferase family protein [Xanthomonas theicola]QNH23916.1 PLP-dependent aminotransferase family protein [Xanthomonas theicola]